MVACHQTFNFQRRPHVDIAFALTAPIVSKQDVPNHHEKRKTKRQKRQDSIHACVWYEENTFGKDDVKLSLLIGASYKID